MLRKLIDLNKDDLMLYAGVNFGVFLILQVVMCVVMVLLFPCDAIMVSHILMLVISAICMFSQSLAHVNFTYVQAIQFGQNRKRALGLLLKLVVFETVFTMATVTLLAWVERNLCPYLWMAFAGAEGYTARVNGYVELSGGNLVGIVLNIDAFVLTEWWWTPLVLGIATVLGIITGALIQRFGRTGGWGLWAIWMFVCIGGPRLDWEHHTILDWALPLAGTVVLISFVWSIWSLLRATVKS